MRALVRHGLGWVTAGVTLPVLPHVAGAVSSSLSHLLLESDGSHFYHVSLRAEWPGFIVLLGVVSLICGLGDLARGKHQWLRWAVPVMPAMALGAWMTFVMRDGEFPVGGPIVMGTTLAVLVLLLVGAYWMVLLLTTREAAAHERST